MPAINNIEARSEISIMSTIGNVCRRTIDNAKYYSIMIPREICMYHKRAEALQKIAKNDIEVADAFRKEQELCAKLTTQEIKNKTQLLYFSTSASSIQRACFCDHYNKGNIHTIAHEIQEYNTARQLLVYNKRAEDVLNIFLEEIILHMRKFFDIGEEHLDEDTYYMQMLIDNITYNRFNIIQQILAPTWWPQAMIYEMLQLVQMLDTLQCREHIADITHIVHLYADNNTYTTFFMPSARTRDDRYAYAYNLRLQSAQQIRIHENTLCLLRAFALLTIQNAVNDVLSTEFTPLREEYLSMLSRDARAYRLCTHSQQVSDTKGLQMSYDIAKVRVTQALHSWCLTSLVPYYVPFAKLDDAHRESDMSYVICQVLLNYDDIIHNIMATIESGVRACVILYMLQHNKRPIADELHAVCHILNTQDRQLTYALGNKIIEYTINAARIAYIIHNVLRSKCSKTKRITHETIETTAYIAFVTTIQYKKHIDYLRSYATTALFAISHDSHFLQCLQTIYEATKQMCIVHECDMLQDLTTLIEQKHNNAFQCAMDVTQKIARRAYSHIDAQAIGKELQQTYREMNVLQPRITLAQTVLLLEAMRVQPIQTSLSHPLYLRVYIYGIMASSHLKLARIMRTTLSSAARQLCLYAASSAGVVWSYYLLSYLYNAHI